MEAEKPLNRVGTTKYHFIVKKIKSIKGLLSREEMRQIQGGCGTGNRCSSNSDCPGSAICCGPPGGAQYCQNCPCASKCD